MPLIGAHVSVAGGLYNCFDNAKRIGAECLQIFGASPRAWAVPWPSAEAVGRYKEVEKKSKLGPVFLHAAYLVNLATPRDKLWYGSIGSLSAHLELCNLLGAQGLVFHIGSAKGWSQAEGIKRVAEGVRRVLDKTPGKAQLIMENAAGGGDKLGATAEEIGEIFQLVKNSRVKVCIDTQHLLAAGVLSSFTPPEIIAFVKKCDRAFGWKNVVVIHANDSKSPSGSHFDRHENIGDGFIGQEGFSELAKNKSFASLPWILEVPGFADAGPDEKNVRILKGIVGA